MLWSCLPKSKRLGHVLHPCGPVTGPGLPGGLSSDNYYKSSPVRKCFAILTFRHGDKRARCKYCNLAFMQFIQNFCSVCYSVFYVCCLNLDSVFFDSEFCLASSTFLKSLLSMISFSF